MLFLFFVLFTLIILVIFFRTPSIKCFSPEAFERFGGKTVLVTGASSGLGKEIARLFFNHGSKVIMAARRINELEQIKTEFMKSQSNDHCVKIEPVITQLDLADPDQSKVVAEQISKDHQVDILINNAGVSSRAASLDTILDVEKSILYINFLSQITFTKVILNSMIQRGSVGQILAVSSVQGRLPLPFRSSYSASKHALQAYYDSLRSELSQLDSKIHISVVSPGYIRTNLSLNAMNPDGTKYNRMDPTTASGYEPKYVASCCAEMLLNGTKELILAPIMPRMMIIIRTLCPKVYFYFMTKYASAKKMKKQD